VQGASLASQLLTLREGTASQDAQDLRSIQQLQAQVRELQGTLLTSQAAAAAAKKQTAESEKRADESHAALAIAQDHSSGLAEKLNAASVAAAEASRRAADAAKRTDDSAKEVSRLRGEADGMRSQIARLEREVESQKKAAENENAKDDAEIASLNAEIKAVNSRLAVSLNKTTALTADLASVKTTLSATESRCGELEAGAAAASAADGAEDAAVASAKAQAKAAEEARAAAAAQLAAARTALEAEQQSVLAAQTEARVAKEATAEYKAAVAKGQAAAQDLKAQLAAAVAQAQGSAAALVEAQSNLQASRAQLSAAEKAAGEDSHADAKLKSAFAALQASKAEADVRADALAGQLAEAKGLATAAAIALSVAEAARDTAQKEVAAANKAAHAAEIARDTSRAELDAAQNKLQVASTEAAGSAEALSVAKAELVAVRHALSTAEKAAGEDSHADAKLKSAFAALQASKAEADARADALAGQLAEAKGLATAAAIKAGELEAARAQLVAQVATEQSALNALQGQLASVNAELSAAQVTAVATSAALESAMAARDEFKNTVTGLRAQLVAAHEAAAADSSSDSKVQAELQAARSAEASASERVGALSAQVSDLQHRASQTAAQLEAALAKVSTLESAAAEAQGQVAATKELMAAAAAATAAATTQANSHMATLESKSAALEDVRDQVTKLRAELAAAQQAAIEDDSADAKLKSAFAALQASKAEAAARADALAGQLDAAKAQLAEAQTAATALSEKLQVALGTMACAPGDDVEAKWPNGSWYKATVLTVGPDTAQAQVAVEVQRHPQYNTDGAAACVTVSGRSVRLPSKLLPPPPPAKVQLQAPVLQAEPAPEESTPGDASATASSAPPHGQPAFSAGDLVEVCISGKKWDKATVDAVAAVPASDSVCAVWMYTVSVPTKTKGDNETHTVLAERVRPEQAARRKAQKQAAKAAAAKGDSTPVPVPSPLPLAHWVFFDTSYLEQWVQEQIELRLTAAADEDVDVVAVRRAVLDGEYTLAPWADAAPDAVRQHPKKADKQRNIHTRMPHEDLYSAGEELPLLWLACMTGGTSAVSWLAAPEQGCSLEERVERASPLIWATAQQRVHRRHGLVRALVAAGADCTAAEEGGEGGGLTPLLAAAHRRDAGTVRVLAGAARSAARARGVPPADIHTAGLLGAASQDSDGRTATAYAALQWTYHAAEAGRCGLQDWAEAPAVPVDEASAKAALRAAGSATQVKPEHIVRAGKRQHNLEKRRNQWHDLCSALVQHVGCDLPDAADPAWQQDTTDVFRVLAEDPRRRGPVEQLREAVLAMGATESGLDFLQPAATVGIMCVPASGMPVEQEQLHAVAGSTHLTCLFVSGAQEGEVTAAGPCIHLQGGVQGGSVLETACVGDAAAGRTLLQELKARGIMKVVLFGDVGAVLATGTACLAAGFAVEFVEDALLLPVDGGDAALVQLEALTERGASECSAAQLAAGTALTRAAASTQVLAGALSSVFAQHDALLAAEQGKFEQGAAKLAARKKRKADRAVAAKARAAKKATRQVARAQRAAAKAAKQAANAGAAAAGPPGDAAAAAAGAVTTDSADPGSSDDSDLEGNSGDDSDAESVQSDEGNAEEAAELQEAEVADAGDDGDAEDALGEAGDSQLPRSKRGQRMSGAVAAGSTAALKQAVQTARKHLQACKRAAKKADKAGDSQLKSQAADKLAAASQALKNAQAALKAHRAEEAKQRKMLKGQKQQLRLAAVEGTASDFAVVSAKYGARDTFAVVTGSIGRRHTHGSQLAVTNTTMSGDPLRGVRKDLFVWAVRGSPVQVKLPLRSAGRCLPSANSLVQGGAGGDAVAAVVVGVCVMDNGARTDVAGVVPACWADNAAPQLSGAALEALPDASPAAMLVLQIVAGKVLFGQAKERDTLHFAEVAGGGAAGAASFKAAPAGWTVQAGLPAARTGAAAAPDMNYALVAAKYGAKDTFAEVSAHASTLLRGGSAFKVTNATMGGDPLRGVRKTFTAWAVHGKAMRIVVKSMDDVLPSAAELLATAGVAPTAPSASIAAVITVASRSGGEDILKSLSACVLVGDSPVPVQAVLPFEMLGALPVTIILVPGAVQQLQTVEGKKGVFSSDSSVNKTATLVVAKSDWASGAKAALAGRVASP